MRIHIATLTDDVLGLLTGGSGSTLEQGFERVAREVSGILLYIEGVHETSADVRRRLATYPGCARRNAAPRRTELRCGPGPALRRARQGRPALRRAGPNSRAAPRALLDPGKDEAARREDDAYRELAERFQDLATRTAQAAAFMADCQTLAPCPHDTPAFGPKHREAFERFVKAQNQLLQILRPAAERDEQMFGSMPKA